MQIWIDADACPITIRDILFKAAARTQTRVTLVANQAINYPKSPLISQIQVRQGFDEADNEIARRVEAGDLVITSDIPLAAEVIEKQALALSPRGEMFEPDTIRQKLNMRDFMDSLRSSGVQTGGPPPMGKADRQNFANHLDRILAAARKR